MTDGSLAIFGGRLRIRPPGQGRPVQKNRLEAFSDGVIAILITIMVLELRIPEGASFAGLAPLLPIFLSYVLSFIYIGIYWNNHHHMLQTCVGVTGGILWANLHLLFWLSLIPVTTGWMGEDPRASAPAVLYGVVLLMAALAYFALQRLIVAVQGANSILRRAIGKDRKRLISLALYALAIAAGFALPWLAQLLYALVAAIWLIPDRRIENILKSERVR